MEGDDHVRGTPGATSFWGTIVQIMLLDIIFSLDSVITAVGMANEITVMIAAVVIAVLVMLVASGYVTRLIDRHPTLKMLALAFLLLIGVTLVADGLGHAHRQGLHLLRDGLRGLRRGPQHPLVVQERQAAQDA